jgi:hypothetical protein
MTQHNPNPKLGLRSQRSLPFFAFIPFLKQTALFWNHSSKILSEEPHLMQGQGRDLGHGIVV